MGYIYKIVNNVNDKVYVGKTCRTLTIRWKEHCKHCNEGVDYPIYRAMKKYGIDAFHMELIEECNNTDICNVGSYLFKDRTQQGGFHGPVIDGFQDKVYFGYMQADNRELGEKARDFLERLSDSKKVLK